MIISVVVLMVVTTYHCSAQPSIRFLTVKTISRDELKQKIDPKDYFPLVETLTAVNYPHQHLPERH
jgi:hypothetical protein